MNETIKKLWNDEEGQGLAEYGLILGLIAVLAIAALTNMGTAVQEILGKIAAGLGKPVTP